jgi:hypothetical protein
LGAAIDIDPALARKILNNNGSVMYRIAVRSLTQDEIKSPTEKKEREEFDIAIDESLGLILEVLSMFSVITAWGKILSHKCIGKDLSVEHNPAIK